MERIILLIFLSLIIITVNSCNYEEFEKINKLKKEITEHFDKFFKEPEFDRLMSKAGD